MRQKNNTESLLYVAPHSTNVNMLYLIGVDKVRVLLVSHVGPHLGGLVRLFILLSLIGTAAVHPDVVHKEQEGNKSTAGLGTHNSKLGRAEIRGVLGLESLGSDDVAQGKGARDDGAGKGALGAAGDVDDSPVVKDGQRSNNGIDQIGCQRGLQSGWWWAGKT